MSKFNKELTYKLLSDTDNFEDIEPIFNAWQMGRGEGNPEKKEPEVEGWGESSKESIKGSKKKFILRKKRKRNKLKELMRNFKFKFKHKEKKEKDTNNLGEHNPISIIEIGSRTAYKKENTRYIKKQNSVKKSRNFVKKTKNSSLDFPRKRNKGHFNPYEYRNFNFRRSLDSSSKNIPEETTANFILVDFENLKKKGKISGLSEMYHKFEGNYMKNPTMLPRRTKKMLHLKHLLVHKIGPIIEKSKIGEAQARNLFDCDEDEDYIEGLEYDDIDFSKAKKHSKKRDFSSKKRAKEIIEMETSRLRKTVKSLQISKKKLYRNNFEKKKKKEYCYKKYHTKKVARSSLMKLAKICKGQKRSMEILTKEEETKILRLLIKEKNIQAGLSIRKANMKNSVKLSGKWLGRKISKTKFKNTRKEYRVNKSQPEIEVGERSQRKRIKSGRAWKSNFRPKRNSFSGPRNTCIADFEAKEIAKFRIKEYQYRKKFGLGNRVKSGVLAN